MKTNYYKTNCHYVQHQEGSEGCNYITTLEGAEELGVTFFSAFDYCELVESNFEEYNNAFKMVIKKLDI